jgi:hypothetical protein
MMKILITLFLMMVTVPIVGSILGSVVGMRAEGGVMTTIFAAWGATIYFVWFA